MSADLAAPPDDPALTALMAEAAKGGMPHEITSALNHIHRVRGLIDPDRAAAALGIPRKAYDDLSGAKSRVNRRIVSMAAEHLDLGSATLPLGRLHLPIPRSRQDVLHAARTIGLIASLTRRGKVMTRVEYEQFVSEFGDDLVKYALGLRRLGQTISADLGWPLTSQAAIAYGCDVLAAWAGQTTPALARLIVTAMPLGMGEGRVHIGAMAQDVDELMVRIIEYHWREPESQT